MVGLTLLSLHYNRTSLVLLSSVCRTAAFYGGAVLSFLRKEGSRNLSPPRRTPRSYQDETVGKRLRMAARN